MVTNQKPLNMWDLTHPREQIATQDYVHKVGQDLDIDRDQAERTADYIASEIERVGGSDARLVFIVDDGTGPVCSWCWAIAGMCPHIAGGQSEHLDKKVSKPRWKCVPSPVGPTKATAPAATSPWPPSTSTAEPRRDQ